MTLKPARWWFFPPVFLGILILGISVGFAPGASREKPVDRALPVRVMVVTAIPVQPRLTGFGEIRPRQTWQGVAQVAGKVAWRHPDLRTGTTFPAGTRLIELEPLDYEVAESRADAQLLSALAAQAELNSRGDDLVKAIAIERRSLEIAVVEYQRNKDLLAKGHISRLQLDAQERELLKQKQTLQNLHSEANLLPAQRRAAAARVEETRAGLDRAEKDLDRTVFTMPFVGRIADFRAETDQFVPAGQTMVTAESTRDVELLLEVPYEHLVARFPAIMPDGIAMSHPGDQLQARLTYQTSMGNMLWQGRVSRIDSGLNANSRSASVYVTVDLAEDEAAPATNLYVQVEIAGPLLQDHIVIPRAAWHAGSVLIADENNRLRRRDVTLAFAQGDQMVLRGGLNEGERLILTDVLFPAVGMTVSPINIEESASL
ncbi:MAG: efflux RND transporter periplasmic adaptor subunit [Pseudomonadales bacterium]